ncbi:hypothetical protein OC834_000225 [Tilletia horrida]|nr:hypothetical protein OC834_000225 [Tilletia horrida]
MHLQQQQQQQQQLAAPTALTGYEPMDVIGNGTFGIIRKVRRISDGRVFARKELNFERMSERDRKQIVAEVNILRNLGHDNIVKYEERFVDQDRGMLYIVMEYCEGGDLGSVIKRYRRSDTYLQEQTVWCYLAQMARALDACHYRGVAPDPPDQPDDCSPLAHAIELNPASHSDATAAATAAAATAAGSPHQSGLAILHRDLKPENVFLDALGNIKLGDFGLSKQVGTAELARTYVGTPYYMSPELATGGPYDAKSDIWALGCIVYELCARKPPFDAANQAELTIKIKAGEVPHLPAQYSPELGNVVRAMLSLNPRNRPTTRHLLQIYQIQLCLKHLDVNALARNLIFERDQLRHTQAQLEAAEVELQRREAALQAAPSSIGEAERQAFAAQVAELEAREANLVERLAQVEAREAQVIANEVDAEKRRAELEKKYIDWYDGERKRAEEVLQENREREEEIRARRESRERARAARKSAVTNSSVGEQTTSVKSGRGSGASENAGGESTGQANGKEDRSAEGPRQADANVTTRSRRPPRVSAMRPADTTGAAGEMSYTTSSRYMNVTAGGPGSNSMVGGVHASASARNLRTLPSNTNILPARRVVSGPRASRVSMAAPAAAENASVMMMDVDTSAFNGPAHNSVSTTHHGGQHHHLLMRERLLGMHPVGSPRSALRADTSARFRSGAGVRPAVARLGGLLGAGGDEVVVEMDCSPAPLPTAARSIKASRVSRAAASVVANGRVEEEEEEEEEEEKEQGDGALPLASDGGSDEWIDQDGLESGGSAKTSTSPSRFAVGTNKNAGGCGNLFAWRAANRADDTDFEDDSADAAHGDGDDHRAGGGRGTRRTAADSSGFDSDVAMESPIAVKIRQVAYRRSLAAATQAPQQTRAGADAAPTSSSPGEHGVNSSSGNGGGAVTDSPGHRLQQQFGRLQLGEAQQVAQAQMRRTPPLAQPAPSSDCDDNAGLGPHSSPIRRTRTSTGPRAGDGSSSSAATNSSSCAAPGGDEEDLPSPFIKRVNRMDSPAGAPGSSSSAANSKSSDSGVTATGVTSSKTSGVLSSHIANGNGNGAGTTFPIRSSSAHNLLVKAVAGNAAHKAAAAAAAQQAANSENERAARRAEIENQRPTASIYPALPVSVASGGTTERSSSALQAIRARRQSTVGISAAANASSSSSMTAANGAVRGGAAGLSGARPSAGVARRLSTVGAAAGVGSAPLAAAGGAPASRVLAGAGVKIGAGRTSLKPSASGAAPAGRVMGPSSASAGVGVGAAAHGHGPPSVALGGAGALIPGVGRRRSLLIKRDALS